MPKSLTRIRALLLIPGLLLDPALAASFHSPLPATQMHFTHLNEFSRQALVARARLSGRRVMESLSPQGLRSFWEGWEIVWAGQTADGPNLGAFPRLQKKTPVEPVHFIEDANNQAGGTAGFDETMRNRGWGVLDTRAMAVQKYAEEITAAYQNIWERIGQPNSTDRRFQVVIDGHEPEAHMVRLSPEVEKSVREWAGVTLQRLQRLFPDEQLKMEHVSVGMAWDLKIRDADATLLMAHVDNRGTYLHATTTLYGASSYLYPYSKSDGGTFVRSDLGDPLIPPTGTTVVITGVDRQIALDEKVRATVHSSPTIPIGDPQKRITLFLGIKTNKQNLNDAANLSKTPSPTDLMAGIPITKDWIVPILGGAVLGVAGASVWGYAAGLTITLAAMFGMYAVQRQWLPALFNVFRKSNRGLFLRAA